MSMLSSGRRLTTIISHLSPYVHQTNFSTTLRPLSTAASSSASYPPLYPSRSDPRVVIIGGIAGGASFAARARRLSESASITIIEKGPHVSVGTCGMPYRIGGEIRDDDALLLQTPQSLAQRLALDVKVNTEAISINREKRLVSVKSIDGGKTDVPYDYLLLSPGSSPLVPPLANINHSRIKSLRTIDDTQKIRSLVNHADNNRIVVIGAGFIGLEVAEQIAKQKGKHVTIVELKDQILPQLDEDIVVPLQEELRRNGIQLKLGSKSGLKAIHTNKSNSNGPLEIELNNGEKLIGDVVVLALGVRPETVIAKKAGLSLAPSGHIIVDDYARTNDDHIYAVGDAVMMKDGVFEKELTSCALGGPANRQARLAADHIFLIAENKKNNNANNQKTGPNGDLSMPPLPYPGSLCTSIVRIFDQVAAITGWNSNRLIAAKKPFRSTIVSGFDHASYYPGAKQLFVKLLWDPENGRLLGAQVVGADGSGVDKRTDVLATALRAKMTIEQMQHLELSYAPPFNGAKDVINLAAFTATNQWKGVLNAASSMKDAMSMVKQLSPDKNALVLDVRDKELVDFHPLSPELGAKAVSLDALRGYLTNKTQSDITDDTPVIAVCSRGKTSYFASRILRHAGVKNVISLMGGTSHHPTIMKQSPLTTNNANAKADLSSSSSIPPSIPSSLPPITLDCSGMSCPGPLLRLKEAASKLSAGQSLHVTASDPGFMNDLPAFAATQGLIVVKCENQKGIIHGVLLKPIEGSSITTSNTNNAPSKGGAAIVVFSGNYDKVLAALVLATGSAAMGGPVTLFFTFFGLSALRKPGSSSVIKNFSSKDLMGSLFGVMLPDNYNAMPMSDFNFAGAGPLMMKKIMNDKQLPTVTSLFEEAKRLRIRLVACTMSMDAMGIKKEELVDGVELGGVADYIAASRNADLKLFI